MNIENIYRNVENYCREMKTSLAVLRKDSTIGKAKPLFAPSQGFPLQTLREFNSFEQDEM